MRAKPHAGSRQSSLCRCKVRKSEVLKVKPQPEQLTLDVPLVHSGVGVDNDGILVLGATNIPWTLDSAIRRRLLTAVLDTCTLSLCFSMISLDLSKIPAVVVDEWFCPHQSVCVTNQHARFLILSNSLNVIMQLHKIPHFYKNAGNFLDLLFFFSL